MGFFAFWLVVVVCIVASAAVSHENRKRGWSEAATELELDLDCGSLLKQMRMTGMIRGIQVEGHSEEVSKSGKGKPYR